MPYGNLNVDTVTTSTAGGVLGAGNASIMKNRLINGDMRIFQRAASVTSSGYFVDRWLYAASQSSKGTANQSSTAPTGFINSAIYTSSSAYSIGAGDYFAIQQYVEGLNISDLAWGTASAKTVTLSFQVQSSLTGTFGGAIFNGSGTRSYPFTYTISAANTWETKTVTIAGDTTGTWTTTNTTGLGVSFGLGVGSTYSGTAGSWAGANYVSATGGTSVVGTSGATFYITGVQLEVGSSATGYEYRQYGQELQLCQRYYEQLGYGSTAIAEAGSTYVMCLQFRTQKRSAASIGLTVTSNIRLRQYGTADRDANTASAGNVASSTTGASFKVSGFNSIGSTSTPACVCYTTSSEDGNLFYASAEL